MLTAMRTPSVQEVAAREEFERHQAEILAPIPTAFHGALRGLAWEQGHSAGYAEVLGDLGELVYRLAPAIAEFKQELSQ